MNHQQMTSEFIEGDNSLPSNTFSAINTIWDRSAKIFTAVIENANCLPDDREYKTGHGVPADKKKDPGTPGFNNKAKTPLTKLMHARLQEEHALWLK